MNSNHTEQMNSITVNTKAGPKTVESPYTDSEAINRLAELVKDQSLRSTFAIDLLGKAERLSEKQMDWVHVLVCEYEQRDPLPQSEIELGRIVQLFELAATNLKSPKITLRTEDYSVKIFKATSPSAKYPGHLYVVEPGYGGKWYGHISPDGIWTHGRATSQPLVDFLQSFANDPAEAASQYGKLTGNCCFCNQGLTTDDSLAVGYGPVCAKNYGLPWGAKHTKQTKRLRRSVNL